MDCLPLVLYLMSLLDSVISSLPAPVSLSMESINFRHILSWDPGPGTPQGTHYKIIKRVEKKASKKTWSSKTTSIKLKLKSQVEYELTVQASYNQSLSAESKPYTFLPVTQTKIGPTNVSLLGCGNCIQVNISFPEADRSAKLNTSMKKFYGPRFVVSWWKPEEERLKWFVEIRETSITLTNLQNGTEYCVQVETKINTNKNTEPSALKCIFTGMVEPSRDPVVVGAVAAALVVGIGVVMTSMFGLYYTGFLCKLKATLPRALIEAQSQGYTLTPETTIPDNISISAGRERPRKPNNATTPQPATRGADSSDEDEDEEGKMYMNRGFSSGENSCQDAVDVSGNSKVSASGGSGSLTGGGQVPDTVLEIEAPHGGGLGEDEPKAEGASLSDGTITGEEEEVCEGSGNINLFSVTLAALAVCEEEEHNTRDAPTDLLQLSDLEPLLHTHSQTESHDQTAVALLLPTQEDIPEGTLADTFSGCLNTCDGEMQHEETTEEEEDEEEEEEEEFCGYMQH
ncbi:LOW QUALITY PROTEIN: cytokine receptor family member b1 [Pseudochaenichthys georgianus]|uniref:LOW QUALITY PROTEIN: cytokine receptor family member b1 n=1 Tax=Pseudochaenichthys georgianus TaxID=52239 RepID=UPI00146AA059|nr:LOW QUALITY PROTEIN: cytokine receptor family member b1 [Pseudochaenichthys georgianus]